MSFLMTRLAESNKIHQPLVAKPTIGPMVDVEGFGLRPTGKATSLEQLGLEEALSRRAPVGTREIRTVRGEAEVVELLLKPRPALHSALLLAFPIPFISHVSGVDAEHQGFT